MEPKFNVWIEREGQVVMSAWRADLLSAIDETGSISAAAERMGLAYRRAWEKIQEMEAGLGVSLLDTAVGGPGGGGAKLTPQARDHLDRFRAFSAGLEEEIRTRFAESFGPEQASR